MTGKMPDEGINPVEFPDPFYPLWGAFCILHRSRPVSMGPLPIPESEIGWYCANRRIRFDRSELALLGRLDSIALEAQDGN